MIVLIDNYDSFVYNLARCFAELGQRSKVVRNDATSISALSAMRPAGVVISPGPCGPAEAGISTHAVTALAGRVPILGICLGHQCIGAAMGASIVRAPEPVHGRTSSIVHESDGLFAGMPQAFRATRYHSLVISEDCFPSTLAVTARSEDGLIMGIAHRTLPVVGVQFHPESILTDAGHHLLSNFLTLAGLPVNWSIAHTPPKSSNPHRYSLRTVLSPR